MARKSGGTAAWAEMARRRAQAEDAKKRKPSAHGVQEVLANFINERLDLSDKARVTPEWIARNHDLAVKVVDLVRHELKVKPPLGGPASAPYGR